MKSVSLALGVLVTLTSIDASACQVSPCPGQPGWNRPTPRPPVPSPTQSSVETAETNDGTQIVIRGQAADEIYNSLKSVRASNKTKVGDQVSCNKLRVETQCTLEVGPRGQVFDNE